MPRHLEDLYPDPTDDQIGIWEFLMRKFPAFFDDEGACVDTDALGAGLGALAGNHDCVAA